MLVQPLRFLLFWNFLSTAACVRETAAAGDTGIVSFKDKYSFRTEMYFSRSLFLLSICVISHAASTVFQFFCTADTKKCCFAVVRISQVDTGDPEKQDLVPQKFLETLLSGALVEVGHISLFVALGWSDLYRSLQKVCQNRELSPLLSCHRLMLFLPNHPFSTTFFLIFPVSLSLYTP